VQSSSCYLDRQKEGGKRNNHHDRKKKRKKKKGRKEANKTQESGWLAPY